MVFLLLFIFYVSPGVLASPLEESSVRPEVYGIHTFQAYVPFSDSQNKGPLPNIFNGTSATPGQFPWQAYLQLWIIENSVFRYCGGSLISPTWILTAAHCLENITATTANLGMTVLNESRVAIDAKTMIVHPDYDRSTLRNDIALVELSSPADTSPYIRTIPLASTTLEAETLVTVSGWGQTSPTSPVESRILQYANLTTIANEVCKNTYGNITSEVVCAAGSDWQSTCHGDSGGPLVTGSGTDAVHVGIVSFGNKKGCDKGYPVGFTRTAAYRSWIRLYAGV